MARFIKAGRFIINIDAVAKIEDLTTSGGLTEININLTNGDYIVLRDTEAVAVLDFFLSRRKDRAGAGSPIGLDGDIPPCTTI